MNDTPARLLRLLSLLQSGRERPGSELAEQLEVSPRTIRRDIDRLRLLGYPVDGSLGAAGGYRLVAGAAMPPLLLDDDEAVAIAVGLRVGAAHALAGIESSSLRALDKVLQVLPARLRPQVAALGRTTSVMTLDSGAPQVDPDVLSMLSRATANLDRVRFQYVDGDGHQTERRVDPSGLVSSGRRWYFVGFDIDRNGWRTFRVDRVSAVSAAGGRATVRTLPATSPAEFVKDRLLSSAPTYRAVAVVHAPIADVSVRLGDWNPEIASIDVIDAAHCRLHLEADTLEWLTRRLVALGCDFVVEQPPELIDHIRDLGSRLVRAAKPTTKPTTKPTAQPTTRPAGKGRR